MKQQGKALPAEALQEFLESATNASKEGQQQFYTPPVLADALFRPLPAGRQHLMMDLHFGNGALARGSGAFQAYGIDIDPRVKNELRPPERCKWTVTDADLTLWYPLAAEIGFNVPFIAINPPFSLQWHSERLAPLKISHLPEVAAVAKRLGPQVDSTLASFLIALDLLHHLGEGLMVCNASTALRFFGEAGAYPELRKFIWLWLTIPGAVFENIQHSFDTSVLYFSASHGRSNKQPHCITAPSADPLAVTGALFTPEVFEAHKGSRVKYLTEISPSETEARFDLLRREYAKRYRKGRPDWNIWIDDEGRLRTHLTTFQKLSRRLDRELVAKLHALDQQPPIALCVTATSRTALREAASCGVWTIEPKVHAAIADALAEYDREGAPFYLPNETMALGWIDEHNRLTCRSPGIGDCQPGESYVISSSIEGTTWKGERINLVGEMEDLQYTGRELLVKITDGSGCEHHFHVRLDDAKEEDSTDEKGHATVKHWHIGDLIRHFEIPIPQDLASLRPDEYEANRQRLRDLEAIINSQAA